MSNMQNPFQQSMVARCKAAISEAAAIGTSLHAGVKGELREILVGKLLTPVLPPEVKIGRGQLVSSKGELSPQCDVILYSPSILPPSLYDEKTGLFPAESCLYSIEVKTKLTATELQSAIKNATKTRSLPLIATEHWKRPNDGQKIIDSFSTATPFAISAIFAFDSDLTGNPQSELDRYRSYDTQADIHPAISVICIVGRGYWYSTIPGWKYVAADENVEEVMSFLAGTTNTLPQLLVAKGRPKFGMYLTTDKGHPKPVP